jgi:hypothetical protein
MKRSSIADLFPVVLFATAILLATLGHKAFLEGCVCIVNALLRAVTVLGAAVAVVLVRGTFHTHSAIVQRALVVAQMLLTIGGTFFLVQHAFFLLEAA